MLFIASGDGDREAVSGLYSFGVGVEVRTGQNAFGLVANIQKNLVGGDGDDCALQLS